MGWLSEETEKAFNHVIDYVQTLRANRRRNAINSKQRKICVSADRRDNLLYELEKTDNKLMQLSYELRKLQNRLET